MTYQTVRAFNTFTTNIKGLPEGEYLTETGYSQSYPYPYPWRVVSKTAKTMTLVSVKVSKDHEWKPDFEVGGFCAHCTNQSDQTWVYDGEEAGYTKVVRLKKSRYCGSAKLWGDKYGNEFVANGARSFYDYNF